MTNTTISINASTRDSLKLFGQKGETYDHILHNLMSIAMLHDFLEEQKRILRTEKFYPVDEI